MVFKLLSRLVNGVKGGVSAGLKGVGDIGSSIVKLVQDTAITVLKESSEFVGGGVDAAASVF